jgi:hypothetical protein
MKKPPFILQIVRIALILFFCCFYSNDLLTGLAAEAAAPANRDEISYSNKKQFIEIVSDSYKNAENWFVNNIRDEGFFVYLYDPLTDNYADKNNMVRQLMASRLLAELTLEDKELRLGHKKNLEFILANWYRESNKGYGYIFYNNKSKLGANAMALRTLSYSPLLDEYSNQAKNIAEGILSLMDDNGAFEPWFIVPKYKYNKDYLLTFYSGEAIVSLVEYAVKSQQEKYLVAAIKAQEYYITKYVERLEQNYYPAYVPWHTISLNKLYKLTNRDEYAKAVLRLNDELLKIQDTTNFIGRFHKPEYIHFGKPHSSSDGVYTESLAYALEIAKLKNDFEHQASYENAIRRSVHNLTKLQYTKKYSIVTKRKETLEGAFRINNANRRVRIDCTQHVMDAYRKILEVF